MDQEAGIELSLGSALHGWLPVTLRSGEVVVSFEASDVPGDPVLELASAIFELRSGRQGQVDWWLEPAWYRFNFRPQGDLLVGEVLFREDDDPREWREVATFKGSLGATLDQITIALLAHIDRVDSNHWFSYEKALVMALRASMARS